MLFSKFQVVEFLDGVQVVPISWLSSDKTKCMYPVHINNQNQYNKMVTTMGSPNESWKSWDVLKVIGSSGEICIEPNIFILFFYYNNLFSKYLYFIR